MNAAGVQNGAMMIREGFLLPESAELESRSYSKTWRTLAGTDSFAMDQKLRAAGLHMFFIAGELKVVELGMGAGATRRGMKRILARGRKNSMNCMEITRIRPAHFLGVPCVVICGYSFHIQSSATLHSKTQRQLEQQDRDWASG
ncbi:MAG TPA: hypothetical protein VLT16_14100 [Candidatus Limnocylindrales bacterium]|nr:hypothetical protein [Candidatus Limnocylindrales bacterium]